MSANKLVELRKLHLELFSDAGRVHVLRGVDLVLDRNESVGLVGPSGSGKSSLMAVIAGLERPTAGSVFIEEHDITDMDEDRLAQFRRRRISIVFQAFHLIPTMTALENVALPLEFAGIDNAMRRATDDLAAVGLQDRLKHYPSQLSGGEQQRVALARAMAPRPQLLLADEPTGNLDGETGQKIIELMFELHRAHNTALMIITHDLELAARCDRLVHLRDGQIQSDQPVSSVLAGG